MVVLRLRLEARVSSSEVTEGLFSPSDHFHPETLEIRPAGRLFSMAATAAEIDQLAVAPWSAAVRPLLQAMLAVAEHARRRAHPHHAFAYGSAMEVEGCAPWRR